MNKKNLKLYQQLQQVYTNVIDMTTADRFEAFRKALKNSPDYLQLLFSYQSRDGLTEPFYNLSSLTAWAMEDIFDDDSDYSSDQQTAIANILVGLDDDTCYWPEIDIEKAKVKGAFRVVSVEVMQISMQNVLTTMLLDNSPINTEPLDDLELGLRAMVGKSRVTVEDEHGAINKSSDCFIADVLDTVKHLASLRK